VQPGCVVAVDPNKDRPAGIGPCGEPVAGYQFTFEGAENDSIAALMLLRSSSRDLSHRRGRGFGEEMVELAGDEALEASDDVLLGEALCGAAFHIGDGGPGAIAYGRSRRGRAQRWPFGCCLR